MKIRFVSQELDLLVTLIVYCCSTFILQQIFGERQLRLSLHPQGFAFGSLFELFFSKIEKLVFRERIVDFIYAQGNSFIFLNR